VQLAMAQQGCNCPSTPRGRCSPRFGQDHHLMAGPLAQTEQAVAEPADQRHTSLSRSPVSAEVDATVAIATVSYVSYRGRGQEARHDQ
jgi:hypothetical protein